MDMRKAMIIEQMGSAMFQPKNRMSNDEMMTPTLPSVSARMCKNTPSNILLVSPPPLPPWSSCEWPWSEWECEQPPLPAWLWPWSFGGPAAWLCEWLWVWQSSACEWLWDEPPPPPPNRECECPWEPPPPCEWPWWLACSPPCWNTNMPIRLTKKPRTETTNKRSWWISGGAASLYL